MMIVKGVCGLLLTALLVTAGVTSPASASKEERIRTEAIDIFFPKSMKAPTSGCSSVPIRYEWRYFINYRSVGASVTFETKNNWMLGYIFLDPDPSGTGGVANLKFCAERWVDEDEIIDGVVVPGDTFQAGKKGRYFIDLLVYDGDNKDNHFQLPKRKSITLK
jgi:hypothetical protein